ncbi:hypothetical protein [Halobacillus sp. A5]|uniref:hypothetical protein n=1 Tax=Halobacillus sp. A5 TaxID=2880263 RepID=UPI0020A65A19|nr:hypothetical protein [Halobacillus sp. A5]MCP3029324.1 hypothetical protein [Halobacillus sp. A5]
MKNKSRWIAIAVIAVGFAIAVQWSMSDEDNATEKLQVFQNPSADEIDLPSAIEEVESHEEIEQFYEQQAPGYQKAKKMEIVQTPDQSFAIPEHEGALTVDEMWYSQHQLMIYYSIDLAVFMDKEDSPHNSFFKISEINLHSPEGDLPTQSHTVHMHGMEHQSLKTYNGKLYGFAAIPRLEQEGMDSQVPGQIQDTALEEEALTSFRLEMNDGFHKTEEETVKYTYDPGQDTLHTEEFNKSFDENGLTVIPKKIDFGISSNKISFELEHDDYEVVNLKGTFTADGEDIPITSIYKNRKDSQNFITELPSSNSIPESIKIDVDSVDVVRDEEYSFEIDVSDYDEVVEEGNQQERMQTDEKIAEHLNTDIILKEKTYNPSMNSQFMLSYEPQSDDDPYFLSAQPGNPYEGFNSTETYTISVDDEELNPNPGIGYGGEQTILDISSYSLEDAEKLQVDFKKAAISQKVSLTEEIKID